MAISVYVKTLTRRKTRVNDPYPSQPGLGTSGVSGSGVSDYGGYQYDATGQPITNTHGVTTSFAGQRVGGITNDVALVDLTDGATRRIFNNKSATIVVLPDVVANFQQSGAVTVVGTASGMVFRAPRAMNVWGVAAQVGAVPTGATAITVDVKSCSSPTAAGTSIFVDATRLPSIAASADYSVLGGTSFMGYPGGSSVVAAGYWSTQYPFGTAGTGLGTSGNSSAFLGSALGAGTVTPDNTFMIPAGSFLRVEVTTVGNTVPGTALSVQIFGY